MIQFNDEDSIRRPSTFSDLPQEIWWHIFSFCSEAVDRLNLMCVSEEMALSLSAWEARKVYPTVQIGGNFMAALNDQGEIHTWGKGTHGRLGHGDEKDQWKPAQVLALQGIKIQKITVYPKKMAAISNEGQVYTWGEGQGGALGHGDENDRMKPTWVAALKDVPIQQVIHCYQGMAARSRDGHLYFWGKGWDQCIIQSQNPLLPLRLESLKDIPIKHMAGHWGFMAAVCQEGKLYTWGCRDLGHGDPRAKQNPTLVKAFDGIRIRQIEVRSVSPTRSVVAVISEAGKLYTWGYGGYLNLGHGDHEEKVCPTLVQALQNENVREIKGSSNVQVIQARGKLYGWGSGSYGRLGLGNEDNQPNPVSIGLSSFKGAIRQVVVDSCHAAAIDEKGQLYMWGSSQTEVMKFQQPSSTPYPPHPVEALQGVNVRQIASSRIFSTHMVALSQEGGVYTWGKGKCGSLGHGSTEDRAAPKRIEDFCLGKASLQTSPLTAYFLQKKRDMSGASKASSDVDDSVSQSQNAPKRASQINKK